MKSEQYQWSVGRGWQPGLPAGTLGDAAQLVLVFGGCAQIVASQCFERVRKVYPHAHVVGCTTAGEIHGLAVGDDTITITAVAFEHTRVGIAHALIQNREESFQAGERLARQIETDGLRHVFVVAEGVKVNGSDLVRGINAVIPGGVTVSGGFAGDGNRLQQTHVWCDSEPETSSVAAIGFYGERLRIGLAASGGWDPFGPDRLITKSCGNVLYELDGRSALALYKEYLGEHAAGLPASGMLYPLGLRVAGGSHLVLRSLIAIDEEKQSLTFGGDMPQNSYARLLSGNVERLIEGAESAAMVCAEGLGTAAAELALLVSCNGRRPILRQLVEEEVEAVGSVLGAQTVLTGFYSYGEIAPVAIGGRSELHNQTMTITALSEV